MDLPRGSSVSINGARLVDRINELAQIGAIDGTPGCSRLAFSAADREGRALVVTWLRHPGLPATTAAVGHAVASTTSHAPTHAAMTGSHSTPVPRA